MHVHLPKPLHGWREFVGEVGIIVLGVLLALSAEQIVETLHWRGEARDFRKALKQEMSIDLGNYRFSQLQQPCVRRRLDELQTYLDRSRDGATVRLVGKIGEPLFVPEYRSVWDNKDAQVVAHIPVEERLRYAQWYDEFRMTANIEAAETEIWHKFFPFEEAGPLTLEERRQLHALIVQARNLSSAMDTNWPSAQQFAAELGLKPQFSPGTPDLARFIPRFDICRPILKTS